MSAKLLEARIKHMSDSTAVKSPKSCGLESCYQPYFLPFSDNLQHIFLTAKKPFFEQKFKIFSCVGLFFSKINFFLT